MGFENLVHRVTHKSKWCGMVIVNSSRSCNFQFSPFQVELQIFCVAYSSIVNIHVWTKYYFDYNNFDIGMLDMLSIRSKPLPQLGGGLIKGKMFSLAKVH